MHRIQEAARDEAASRRRDRTWGICPKIQNNHHGSRVHQGPPGTGRKATNLNYTNPTNPDPARLRPETSQPPCWGPPPPPKGLNKEERICSDPEMAHSKTSKSSEPVPNGGSFSLHKSRTSFYACLLIQRQYLRILKEEKDQVWIWAFESGSLDLQGLHGVAKTVI